MFKTTQNAVFIEYDDAGRLKLTDKVISFFKFKLLQFGNEYKPLVNTKTGKEIGGIYVFCGLAPIVKAAIESQNSILGETSPMEVTI